MLTLTTIIIIVISYKKENVMFIAKKIIALISIHKISNRRQKNFRGKTENLTEIKPNITYFL